ncbi:MAG: Rnase Y domain-containing protein, partial [Candidatus Aminicenantes bacterium]|nr:Rnase Y domain-containing protein [Candidatus Aminicenantes bacterium]
MNTILLPVAVVFCVLLAATIFLLLKKTSGSHSIFNAHQEAKAILDKAAESAESIKREASIGAKEKYLNLKTEFENQTQERRQKINEM